MVNRNFKRGDISNEPSFLKSQKLEVFSLLGAYRPILEKTLNFFQKLNVSSKIFPLVNQVIL